MESLDGCQLRSSSALDDARCFAAVENFNTKSRMVLKYWETGVWSSGGAADTKNKLEQTNFGEATWVMEGTINGLKKLYPDRYDDNGVLLKSCAGTAGTVYGADCDAIIATYAAGLTEPCQGADACNAAVKCYPNNDNTATAWTTTTNCDLVELDHGYSQWQDKSKITCTTTTFKTVTGFASCMQLDGAWVYRGSYTNQDQPRFRTLGEKIATETTEGAVKDTDISCLAADFKTVRTGSANCWAYWLEGQS